MPRNTVDPTTKMAPKDINQDDLAKEDQQRTDDSALDMMKAMHEHEDHKEEDEQLIIFYPSYLKTPINVMGVFYVWAGAFLVNFLMQSYKRKPL